MELYLHSPYMSLRHIQDNCGLSLILDSFVLNVPNSPVTVNFSTQSQEANVNQAELLYTCCNE